ncbi:uncharacterized protein [Prorops nasuta]|uniref:uncharacterized protein n=1 Tax=Prorops nasuta TaxID=863751 RepID=UPI0034CD5DF2
MNNDAWRKQLKFYLNKKKHILNVFQFEDELNKDSVSVILADTKFIKKFESYKIISIDATFDATPQIEDAGQLLIIMAKYKEKFVPIIWTLMSNKLERTYVQIFKFIKQKVMKGLNPIQCICDYERGLHNAIRIVFDKCHVTGCYFHYVQSLRKHYIEHGFNFIVDETRKDESLNKHFLKYLKYFKQFWIKTVDKKTLSVYRIKDLTNNSQERFHKLLTRNAIAIVYQRELRIDDIY